jgi:hypothetical protein
LLKSNVTLRALQVEDSLRFGRQVFAGEKPRATSDSGIQILDVVASRNIRVRVRPVCHRHADKTQSSEPNTAYDLSNHRHCPRLGQQHAEYHLSLAAGHDPAVQIIDTSV